MRDTVVASDYMSNWMYLAIAICAEVVATSALKASDGFSKFGPSMLVLAGYSVAFFCMSLTLRTIPLGVVYAIWAGSGMALIGLVGWVLFGQRIDTAGIVGIALIVLGVVVINVFSKSAVH
jgi:small multidrug resistance pump